jgi:hypothetical protein
MIRIAIELGGAVIILLGLGYVALGMWGNLKAEKRRLDREQAQADDHLRDTSTH